VITSQIESEIRPGKDYVSVVVVITVGAIDMAEAFDAS
jgi:hypothetical protein